MVEDEISVASMHAKKAAKDVPDVYPIWALCDTNTFGQGEYIYPDILSHVCTYASSYYAQNDSLEQDALSRRVCEAIKRGAALVAESEREETKNGILNLFDGKEATEILASSYNDLSNKYHDISSALSDNDNAQSTDDPLQKWLELDRARALFDLRMFKRPDYETRLRDVFCVELAVLLDTSPALRAEALHAIRAAAQNRIISNTDRRMTDTCVPQYLTMGKADNYAMPIGERDPETERIREQLRQGKANLPIIENKQKNIRSFVTIPDAVYAAQNGMPYDMPVLYPQDKAIHDAILSLVDAKLREFQKAYDTDVISSLLWNPQSLFPITFRQSALLRQVYHKEGRFTQPQRIMLSTGLHRLSTMRFKLVYTDLAKDHLEDFPGAKHITECSTESALVTYKVDTIKAAGNEEVFITLLAPPPLLVSSLLTGRCARVPYELIEIPKGTGGTRTTLTPEMIGLREELLTRIVRMYHAQRTGKNRKAGKMKPTSNVSSTIRLDSLCALMGCDVHNGVARKDIRKQIEYFLHAWTKNGFILGYKYTGKKGTSTANAGYIISLKEQSPLGINLPKSK